MLSVVSASIATNSQGGSSLWTNPGDRKLGPPHRSLDPSAHGQSCTPLHSAAPHRDRHLRHLFNFTQWSNHACQSLYERCICSPPLPRQHQGRIRARKKNIQVFSRDTNELGSQTVHVGEGPSRCPQQARTLGEFMNYYPNTRADFRLLH